MNKMSERDWDLYLTEWGINTFLKSTGRKPSMFMLGAHYADDNPSVKNIRKMLDIYLCIPNKNKTKDEIVKNILEEW